jgi:uncharacterized protein YecE (DUF72 family)
MTDRVLLGSQGWAHPGWVGTFYPGAAEEMEMLHRYAAEFPTVEVAETFAGIPPESLMKSWRDAVPDGFKFSLRVPQQVTHERRFVDGGRLLQRFLERVRLLQSRLGPLLITMPVGFPPTEDARNAVTNFLKSLPSGFSWVIECRRADWLTAGFLDGLHEHKVALALVEGRWIRRGLMLQLARMPTADFMYLRFAGKRLAQSASRTALMRRRALSTWSSTVDDMKDRVEYVAGYFSQNFDGGESPQCIRDFRDLLSRALLTPRATGDRPAPSE